MNDMTPNPTAALNEKFGWRFPDWEIAYDVWKKDELITKRRSFRTEEAMLKFIDKQEETNDNWHGVRGTRYPQYR